MNEKDAIKDLFRDKLQSHEVMPSNAVWSSVSSSLGHSAASGFGAASFLKVAAAVVGVTTIGVVGYILLDTDKASPANTNTNTMTVAPIEATEVETSTIESNSISEGDKSILSNVPVVSPNSVGKKMIAADLVQETQPEIMIVDNVKTPLDVKEDVVPVVSENIVVESPVSLQTSLVEAPQASEDVSNNISQEAPETSLSESDLEIASEEVPQVEEEIILPNVFTPNGDRVNDVFEIEIGEKLEFQIVVLNQLNQVIFKSSDSAFKWDGTMLNGEPAPSGNYVYFLSAKNMNGDDFVKSSMLLIQR